jgi:hypothetical protein
MYMDNRIIEDINDAEREEASIASHLLGVLERNITEVLTARYSSYAGAEVLWLSDEYLLPAKEFLLNQISSGLIKEGEVRGDAETIKYYFQVARKEYFGDYINEKKRKEIIYRIQSDFEYLDNLLRGLKLDLDINTIASLVNLNAKQVEVDTEWGEENYIPFGIQRDKSLPVINKRFLCYGIRHRRDTIENELSQYYVRAQVIDVHGKIDYVEFNSRVIAYGNGFTTETIMAQYDIFASAIKLCNAGYSIIGCIKPNGK